VPLSNRRKQSSGFSRRAQMSLFLGFVTAIAAVTIGLLLALISRSNSQLAAPARIVLTEVTAPVGLALRWPIERVADGVSLIDDYFGAVARARSLETAAAQGRRDVISLRLLEIENRRLKALMDMKSPTQHVVAYAAIVGSSPAAFTRTAVIAAGSNDGVAVGQPARNSDGLVGRVIEVGPNYARVLLLTDAQSRVPVTLARNGAAAIAAGDSHGLLEVRTIEADRNPFRTGDLLVTSGVGGTFAPDIPVAVITAVDGEGATARPITRPERLREVLVQTPYMPMADVPLPQPATAERR
jgi:rod shape-determining protein MreC